jgi:uncharacterized Zn finger protein
MWRDFENRRMSDPESDHFKTDIPIRFCPNCKGRPMVVDAVIPRLRLRDGTEVKYRCTKCGTVEQETLKPLE